MLSSVFQGPVFTVAFSRGGDLFASGGADSQVCGIMNASMLFTTFLPLSLSYGLEDFFDSGYNISPHKYEKTGMCYTHHH